jgi:hypothetical protein
MPGPDKQVPPNSGPDRQVSPKGKSEGHACRSCIGGARLSCPLKLYPFGDVYN